MRLIETASLKQGSILGKTIFNDKGLPLLKDGVELTKWHIDRLKRYKIQYVYIAEKETSHIVPKEAISQKLRSSATQKIDQSFTEIQEDISTITDLTMEKASNSLSQVVKQLMEELKGNQGLFDILSDVYTYDHYIFTHSLNVTLYSLSIGLELNLSPKELQILGLGAIMHDVGKMRVPEEILFKPGRLDEEELLVIQQHCMDGFNMLRKVHSISPLVAHCALQHHERNDGSGYPHGLKERDIHLLAKIIAVADVFDAVTSNRVYRKAMLPNEALELLFAEAGSKFDKNIIEAFRRTVAIFPIGLTVGLSDGHIGVVSRQNMGYSNRPVIEVFEQNGVPLPFRYEIDLKDRLDITVVRSVTAMDENAPKIS